MCTSDKGYGGAGVVRLCRSGADSWEVPSTECAAALFAEADRISGERAPADAGPAAVAAEASAPARPPEPPAAGQPCGDGDEGDLATIVSEGPVCSTARPGEAWEAWSPEAPASWPVERR